MWNLNLKLIKVQRSNWRKAARGHTPNIQDGGLWPRHSCPVPTKCIISLFIFTNSGFNINIGLKIKYFV